MSTFLIVAVAAIVSFFIGKAVGRKESNITWDITVDNDYPVPCNDCEVAPTPVAEPEPVEMPVKPKKAAKKAAKKAK